MRGPLTPEQQVRVLSRIWGDRDGFVFLPWIAGSCTTVEQRRQSYHEGRAYKWPTERSAILDHLHAHDADDVYFTPAIFNGKRRIEAHLDDEQALWADLDPVDPREIDPDKRPTIAWESSPGRFQAVWLMGTPLVGASWPSRENHRLTMWLGADPSGWDSTQLLRVPGRPNHKPDYKGNAPGQLLWDNGPRYGWEDFEDLPEIAAATPDIDLVDDELIARTDRHEVWARVRLKVSSRCREFMSLRTAPVGLDRSETAWEIERELADAGCSVVEIIALIRPSVWNKYVGRADEVKRLKIEAAKAVAQRDENAGALEDEAPKPTGVQWLSSLATQPIPRPRWLVKDIWTVGGCGFIAGQPKSYKSWMALDLAVSVASGMPFLNQPQFSTRPGPVLYLQEEDNLRMVMQRLSAIVEGKAPELHWHGQLLATGTDGGMSARHESPGDDVRESVRGLQEPVPRITWCPPSREIPLGVHVQAGFIASDPGWQAWLADIVAENEFALVIIDTLGTTAGDIDTDRAQDLMTKILRPLKVIAGENDCAICVVHHNRKSNDAGNRAGQQMLGSVALHAWVDAALYARSKDSDGNVTIERETKSTTDLTLKVHVPRMSDDHPVWGPELAEERIDQEQSPPTPITQGKGGKLLASRIKMMGPGPFTVDHINEVMGRDVLGQVEAGVQNGFLQKHEDGRVSYVAQGS